MCLRLSKSRGKRSRNSSFCAAFKTKDAPVKRGGSEYQAHTSVKGETSLLSPRRSAGKGIHKLIKNCSVLIELFLLASHLPIKRLGMAGGNSYFYPQTAQTHPMDRLARLLSQAVKEIKQGRAGAVSKEISPGGCFPLPH